MGAGEGGGKGTSQRALALQLHVWSTGREIPTSSSACLRHKLTPTDAWLWRRRNPAGGGARAGLVGGSNRVPVSLGSLPVQETIAIALMTQEWEAGQG